MAEQIVLPSGVVLNTQGDGDQIVGPDGVVVTEDTVAAAAGIEILRRREMMRRAA